MLERNYCLLYSSGLLLTFVDESLNEAVSAYELSHLSSCQPFIHESILRFKIENAIPHQIKKERFDSDRNADILIELDDGSEDILSQVYSWVTAISQVVEFASMKKGHRDMIDSLWKTTL